MVVSHRSYSSVNKLWYLKLHERFLTVSSPWDDVAQEYCNTDALKSDRIIDSLGSEKSVGLLQEAAVRRELRERED